MPLGLTKLDNVDQGAWFYPESEKWKLQQSCIVDDSREISSVILSENYLKIVPVAIINSAFRAT